jgi:PAS domain S-box-containing protein
MNALFVALLFLPPAAAAAAFPYTWRRRSVPGATPLAATMLALVWWGLGYALEVLAGADLPVKEFWATIKYVGVVVAPTAWLVLGVEYAGYQKWLTRRNLLGLSAVPLAILALALSNALHHWMWSGDRIVSSGPYQLLQVTYEAGFWVDFAYTYGILLVGAAFMLRAVVQRPPLYRRQVAALVLGVLVPWVGNFLYLFHLSPLGQLDITPFAFTVSVLAMMWSLLRYGLLEIVPVARSAVVEGMTDGMLVLDALDRIVDCNPAAERLLGLPSARLIGQPAGQALSAPQAAWGELVERYRDVHTARDAISLGEGETQRDYDLQISALTDRNGRYGGRLIVLHDITDRRRAEEALRDRTLELQARNEELDAFAHTVAHDLKGPLTVITGYSQLLANQYTRMEPEAVNSVLERINQTGNKMTNIVNELLLLASVGKLTHVATHSLEMASIVAEARAGLADRIAERKAEVLTPGEWPVAEGYAPWIEEVWANYLSNALKYGGDPPRIELGWDAVPGGYRFWVRDNGHGVAPDEQARLFTEFTRLDQGRAEGHGLGLSIVKRIVEKLGGQVGIESAPGQGSTFTFTLPRGQA